ncbi:MAG TPA: recombinase family protein, partial [Marivita sp.]|nr:recombinase family protein [Marivita sp.]
MTKTEAYSYLRISTDRQLSGDGIRRQLEQSKTYAEQHDYELVDTLQDIGVSAFKGKNAKEGALGMFIAAIDDGDIEKGSVLIVESLDRLSRDNVLTAFNQFTNIIQKGIGIVT